jgi:hypothetical protein
VYTSCANEDERDARRKTKEMLEGRGEMMRLINSSQHDEARARWKDGEMKVDGGYSVCIDASDASDAKESGVKKWRHVEKEWRHGRQRTGRGRHNIECQTSNAKHQMATAKCQPPTAKRQMPNTPRGIGMNE